MRWILILSLLAGVILSLLTSCYGSSKTRPTDSMLWSLRGLNSAYDDFNLAAPARLSLDSCLIFSSNRWSQGGQFDIVRVKLAAYALLESTDPFQWDQALSPWELRMDIQAAQAFLPRCASMADERGPWVCADPGYAEANWLDTDILADPANPTASHLHYFFDSNRPLSAEDRVADRDIYYYNVAQDSAAPHPVAFNSNANEAYPCLLSLNDGLLFSSDRPGGKGGWDIYLLTGGKVPATSGGLAMDPSAVAKAQATINSAWDDMCPFFLDRVIVFTSNRLSLGASFDLFYAVWTGDGWTEPRPIVATLKMEVGGTIQSQAINSAANEFRPILVKNQDSSGRVGGIWLFFSSDREIPGLSQGGYDLYLAWLSGSDGDGLLSPPLR